MSLQIKVNKKHGYRNARQLKRAAQWAVATLYEIVDDYKIEFNGGYRQ